MELSTLIRRLLGALVLSAAATAASAQANPGDVILGSISSAAGKHGLYAIDWKTGAFKTINSTMRISDVKMAWGNGSIWAADFTLPANRIYRFTAGQSPLLLQAHTGSQFLWGIAPNQDISYIGASDDGNLYRYSVGSASFTTFANLGGTTLRAICRDSWTGDYMVVRYNDNTILRVDRRTGAASTFAVLSGGVLSGIAHVPSSGEFVVTRFQNGSPLVFLRRNGSIRTVHAVPFNGASVTVDEVRDRVFYGTTNGVVIELTSAGQFVWSRSYSGFNWAGMDIYGDQQVSIGTTGRAGANTNMLLLFPGSKNRPYCCALSQGTAPGLRLSPNQIINLRYDPLFAATACGALPLWTRRFTGTTDGNGRANAAFYVPPGAIGSMIYCGAVAINPSYPNGLDIGNTQCIRIEP